MVSRLFRSVVTRLDHRKGWHRFPTPLAVLSLVGIRGRLREQNLYDTGVPPHTGPAEVPERYRTARSADGAWNDLTSPTMGMVGSRFGRNAPPTLTFPDASNLLRPNPRTVSRELLTRDPFIPATTLNVIAAAWLQFMIRDWFSHGKSPREQPFEIPLETDDPWPEHPMRILRTRPEPTRTPDDDAAGKPPTYANVESHWWDGSQIYGSTAELQAKARLGQDGKLRIGPTASCRSIPATNTILPTSPGSGLAW